MAHHDQQIKSDIDVLLSEVTPQMTLEGALVLREWAEDNPDQQDFSLQALAGIVYSRMRMVVPDLSGVARFPDGDSSAHKTARQLKNLIRRA